MGSVRHPRPNLRRPCPGAIAPQSPKEAAADLRPKTQRCAGLAHWQGAATCCCRSRCRDQGPRPVNETVLELRVRAGQEDNDSTCSQEKFTRTGKRGTAPYYGRAATGTSPVVHGVHACRTRAARLRPCACSRLHKAVVLVVFAASGVPPPTASATWRRRRKSRNLETADSSMTDHTIVESAQNHAQNSPQSC